MRKRIKLMVCESFLNAPRIQSYTLTLLNNVNVWYSSLKAGSKRQPDKPASQFGPHNAPEQNVGSVPDN